MLVGTGSVGTGSAAVAIGVGASGAGAFGALHATIAAGAAANRSATDRAFCIVFGDIGRTLPRKRYPDGTARAAVMALNRERLLIVTRQRPGHRLRQLSTELSRVADSVGQLSAQ